jgi:CRP-like cAMP-binding protein
MQHPHSPGSSPASAGAPGKGVFHVLPDRFGASAAEPPRPAHRVKGPRQAAEAPAPEQPVAEQVDLQQVEVTFESVESPAVPPGPAPGTNVVRFLDYSRAAAGAAVRGAGAAARGVARAGAWSATTSTGLVKGIGAWLEKRRTPKVDELRALAEAARYHVVTNRMASIAVLSDEEAHMVRNGTPHRRVHQAGSELAEEGEASPRPMFIMSGWACRLRMTPSGRTQIVGLLLPGDAIGLRGAAEPLSPTTISALTAMETVDAAPLLQVAQDQQQFPGVLHALRRMSAQQEEFLMNQVVRLGTMSPDERLAHLLLELRWRLEQAGLANEREFVMPLNNETLADATALKAAQVAQVMKMLRARSLVRRKYERVEVMNPKALQKLSGFRAPDMSACGRFRMMPANVTAAPDSARIGARMSALPGEGQI